MHERRSTDRETALSIRRDASASDQEMGQSAFPVFADPPFLAWQALHRKQELFQRIHPSSQPVILLWDEVDDYELLS
ncbi:hypothetical protein [Pseudomonas zhanjiangensis]|uniref:Uncharacterized protein n=1 Tax=Pseudomonas zhanjiangensis TaxID=3239015 RepID=A0ABV3YNH4_9PSED